MSTKLTLSAALSVLLMAGYVLFGTPSAQPSLGVTPASQSQVSAASLPDRGSILPSLR